MRENRVELDGDATGAESGLDSEHSQTKSPVRISKKAKGSKRRKPNPKPESQIPSLQDLRIMNRKIAVMTEIYATGSMNLTLNLEDVVEFGYMAKLSEYIEKYRHLIRKEEKIEIERMQEEIKVAETNLCLMKFGIERVQKEIEVAEMKLCLMKLNLIKKEVESVLSALK